MKAFKLPKGTEIAGSDCIITDTGTTTKRVDFNMAAEFFKDKFFGGGGELRRKRTD